MNLTDFRFPRVFGQIGRHLPSPVASAPLMLILALARQRSWLVAPENLYDKTFQIYVEDLGLRLCFRCDHGRFKAIQQQTTDVSLSACAMDSLRLGIAVKYWIDASERPAWLNLLAEKLNSGLNTGSV